MEDSALPEDGEEWLRAFAKNAGVPLEVLADVDRDEADEGKHLSVAVEFGMNKVLSRHGEERGPVIVGGRFRLIRRVGTGSYGSVYEAEDGELARRVAIKVMPIDDPDVADREGKALAAFDHPNIVRIFGHGREDDYRWLELEFIDGPTLDEWCQGKSVREIVACYLEAGEGLDAAHQRGLIHRDFKPRNVMMSRDGRAKVTDFGLARNLESLNDRAPDEGDSLLGSGTLGFLSRERLQGAPGDERSDQFAFCVSLWSALTGAHPFEVTGRLADYFESMGRRPKNGHEVPRRIRRVLERGMAPLPGDRWRTMSQLLEALGKAQRRPVWPWAGIAVLLGALMSLSYIYVDRSVHVEVETLPGMDEAILDLFWGLSSVDEARVLDALRAGTVAARAEHRELEFAQFAILAATKLNDWDGDEAAIYSWAVAVKLSRESHDDETLKAAQEGLAAITAEYSLVE